MRIVHAADLHIDSPLHGLERYEGAPVAQLRNATRGALENLVQLCLEEAASLLLLAGDIFDGDWRDYSTGLFFTAQMARLRQAGVRVVMLRGNHDAQSHITRQLRLPENVRELSTRRAETLIFEDLGVAIHGQGFATREVREDLALRYPQAIAGLFNVGLLHTALTGRVGHEPYAPSTLDVLRNKGYDYWALGHVHQREVVSVEPFVVFPGNLQGRHARELGPKGATVLTIGNGSVQELRHEVLDIVRWSVCQVDTGSALDVHDVLDLVQAALAGSVREAGGRLLAARVVLCGASAAHGSLMRDPDHVTTQLRASSLDVSEGPVWLERVVFRTAPNRNRESQAEQQTRRELLAILRNSPSDAEDWAELTRRLNDLKRKLPAAACEGEDAILLDDPEFVAELTREARELLLARLLELEPL